ncbi:MAG: hypothetical protein LBM96_00850 [Methanobrevibacter sp.]|jgi:hypothetical protein|nr:hypothetical protein [Candidatus Methanoflexus mossambicus]
MFKENEKCFENSCDEFHRLESHDESLDTNNSYSNQEDIVINPLDDSIIQYCFGMVGCEMQFLGLVNAILKDKGYSEIEYIGNNNSKIQEMDKTNSKIGILEVKSPLAENINLNMDVEIIKSNGQEFNIMFYLVNNETVETIKQYEHFENIVDFVHIIIRNNENELDMDGHTVSRWMLKIDGSDDQLVSDKFRTHIINLPKLFATEIIDLDNELHQFALFFNAKTSKEAIKIICEKNEAIKMAEERMLSYLTNLETLNE